jgi:ferredoxin-NADP reductase
VAGTAVLGRLNWQAGRVVEAITQATRVRSLVLDVADWKGHRAGQHVDIRLTADDGYQAVRSYSIGSPPEKKQVEVTVEQLDEGEVSPYLVEEVHEGDVLELRGPIGGYFVWEESQGGPLLLVGGGSGIVPLMAMIRHRIASDSDVKIKLLYSSRSVQDAIYRDELERIDSETGIEIAHTYTRTQPEGWSGYSRRIDRAMLQEVMWPADEKPLSYVCGPTPLVEAVAESLLELGHEANRIKTERFGPTGG